MREGVGVHADSGVADLHPDDVFPIESLLIGHDGERATAWHRVQRIFDDVRERPREQRPIDEDLREIAGHLQTDADSTARPVRYGSTTSSIRSTRFACSGRGVGDEAKLENSAEI